MSDDINLSGMIRNGGIFYDVEGKTPQEIYKKITNLIDLPDGISSEQVYNALCAREAVLSTAVGNGIALPHARTPLMKSEEEQKICVVYLKEPLEMNAPDERPVNTMFILLTANPQIHLKVLSSLAALFRSARFREALDNHADEISLTTLIKELV